MRDWQREMDRRTGFYDLRHFPLSAWPTIIRKYCPHASDHNMQITDSASWPRGVAERGHASRPRQQKWQVPRTGLGSRTSAAEGKSQQRHSTYRITTVTTQCSADMPYYAACDAILNPATDSLCVCHKTAVIFSLGRRLHKGRGQGAPA